MNTTNTKQTLESLIDNNRALFDRDPLPEGHQARFQARLAAAQNAGASASAGPSQAGTPGTPSASAAPSAPVASKRWAWLRYSAVAASVALLVGIGGYFFTQQGDANPCSDSSYLCYIVEMQRISDQVEYKSRTLSEARRQELMLTLSAMVPVSDDDFLQTLPPELSTQERDRLLNDYYAQLYEGVKEIAATAKK